MVVIGKGGTQARTGGKSKDRARSHLGPALAGTDRLLRPTDRVRGVDEAVKMCDPGVHRQSGGIRERKREILYTIPIAISSSNRWSSHVLTILPHPTVYRCQPRFHHHSFYLGFLYCHSLPTHCCYRRSRSFRCLSCYLNFYTRTLAVYISKSSFH